MIVPRPVPVGPESILKPTFGPYQSRHWSITGESQRGGVGIGHRPGSIWRDEQVLRPGPPDSLSCNSNELCLRRDAGRTLCLEASGLVGGDQPAASAYSACYRAATSGSDWPHPPRRAPRGPREPMGSLRAYAANSIYTTNRSFHCDSNVPHVRKNRGWTAGSCRRRLLVPSPLWKCKLPPVPQ